MNVRLLLEPLLFEIITWYVPADRGNPKHIAPKGQVGMFADEGTMNWSVVPLPDELRFASVAVIVELLLLLLRITPADPVTVTVFPLAVNPEPVRTTCVPTDPLAGERDARTGAPAEVPLPDVPPPVPPPPDVPPPDPPKLTPEPEPKVPPDPPPADVQFVMIEVKTWATALMRAWMPVRIDGETLPADKTAETLWIVWSEVRMVVLAEAHTPPPKPEPKIIIGN